MQQYQQYQYGSANYANQLNQASPAQQYYNQMHKWKHQQKNTHVQSQSQPQLFGNNTNTNYPQKNTSHHQYGGSTNNVFQSYASHQWPMDQGVPPPPPPIQEAEKQILDVANPLNMDEIKRTVNDRYFNSESEKESEDKITRNKPKRKKKNSKKKKKRNSKTPNSMMDEWDAWDKEKKNKKNKKVKKAKPKLKKKKSRSKSPRPKNLLKKKNKFVGHNYKDDASSSEDSADEVYVSKSKENAKRRKKMEKKKKAYK